jgi:hypothetical protein
VNANVRGLLTIIACSISFMWVMHCASMVGIERAKTARVFLSQCDKYCHYQYQIDYLNEETVRLHNLIVYYNDDMSMEEAFQLNREDELFNNGR